MLRKVVSTLSPALILPKLDRYARRLFNLSLNVSIYFLFSIAISRSKDVPPFGPSIPEYARFPKSAEFAQFLLAKGEIF